MLPELNCTTSEEVPPHLILGHSGHIRIFLLVVVPVKAFLAFVLGDDHVFCLDLISIGCKPVPCDVAFRHLDIVLV